MNQEPFKLERPAAPRKSKPVFHNNTKPDGTPLSQMVLFSGSTTCLPGQRDLFNLADDKQPTEKQP